MSNFTQTPLSRYLGTWMYENNGRRKYYRVVPYGDKHFEVRWGKTLSELGDGKSPNKIILEDTLEVYKRILSKRRGGFQKYGDVANITLTPKCFDTFDDMDEVLEREKSEAVKRKPRQRKISLLDWMSGMETYRENDQP